MSKIETLESRRLLSAAGWSASSVLGAAYQGFARLHLEHGRSHSRVAVDIDLNATLDANGNLDGTLNLANEPPVAFSAALKRHTLHGALVSGGSGDFRGIFSQRGVQLSGRFTDAVQGQILVGQFNVRDLALMPKRGGTGRAAASTSGVSTTNNGSTAIGFSQTALGSTLAGSVVTAGSSSSASTGSTTGNTGNSTTSGSSSTSSASGATTAAGSRNLSFSDTISLPALGLTIGSLDGDSDLAAGVNGSPSTSNGSTTIQQNASVFGTNNMTVSNVNNASTLNVSGNPTSTASGTGNGLANAAVSGSVNAGTTSNGFNAAGAPANTGITNINATTNPLTGVTSVNVAPISYLNG